MIAPALMYYTSRLNSRIYHTILIVSVFLVTLLLLASYVFNIGPASLPGPRSSHAGALETRNRIISSAKEFISNELPSSAFGEMGRRTESLTEWFESASRLERDLSDAELQELTTTLDQALISTYPFLQDSDSDSSDQTVVSHLTRRFTPGSRGIVVASGKAHLRYAFHLIANLKHVLKSTLPIQVVYAGDQDLPPRYRDLLTSSFEGVETLDILTVFDDPSLDLEHGGWAIKPFALLASKFEQTILVDADSVFLQKPEVILESHKGYLERGALLFHDRLLWKNVFVDRAKWWRKEMGDRVPSDTLMKSKVWTEGYAEEGDSGVVVMDKGRLPVLLGLLHICWQNTAPVRNEFTYRITYGDKESYWFGLELSAVPFVFEDHYGSVVGEVENKRGVESVCSFTIAHVDEKIKLLWYNGSLLKDKLKNQTDFLVPEFWMTDGEWVKGRTKQDLSCMRRTQLRRLDEDELRIIAESVEEARQADAAADAKGFDLIADSKY